MAGGTGKRRAPRKGGKTGDGEAPGALDTFLDRLFGAPLAGFIATRKALAGELRARGDARGAKAIAAAHKPTPTAWAVNQVALHHPDVVARLVEAAAAVRDAQRRAMTKGDASTLRDAMRAMNTRIAEGVREAKRAFSEAGKGATASQLRRIGRTLHALPLASPDEAEALARGRLVKDLEPASDLSALGIAPARRAVEEEDDAEEAPAREPPAKRPARAPRGAARRAPPAAKRPDRSAAREARAEERRAAHAAAAREKAAAGERARAEREASRERRTREMAAKRLETRARAAADHAAALVAAAEDAEGRAEKARAAARDAEATARDARRAADEARKRV